MSKAVAAATSAVLLLTPHLMAGLLSVPKDYTPKKSWPVIVSIQDNPSTEQMATVPYFLVHAGGKAAELTTKIRTYLKNLAARYNIDPLRIYGTGFSRGGHELLAQAWQHPHWFAAIAPVCNDLRGEPKVLNVKYLNLTPTLLLHGKGDSFLRTGKVVFEHMKQAGCNVQFQTYDGGHSPKLPFKENVKLLTDFFDKHKLDPFPKTVVHLVSHKRYSRAFWINARLTKDAGGQKAVVKVAARKGNRIEIDATAEIAAVDLYLNDKLVDPAKPVTITAGDRQLYKGPVSAKLTVTLKEGPAFGRRDARPLWEEMLEARAKAKAAAKK